MLRPVVVWWNADERRPRAFWRLVVYLLLVAAIANPLILLLDATGNRLLEASLENVLVAIGSVWRSPSAPASSSAAL